MKRTHWDLLFAVLVFVQAAASLLSPPYRDTGWVVDTWFGNDLVTLVVVFPLLSLSSLRNAGRMRIVNAGCAGYAVYNYCFYLLGTRLNVLFPLYAALVLLGLYSLSSWLGAGSRAEALVEGFDKSKSYRLPGILFLVIGAGLGSVWLGTWAANMFFGGKLPVAESEFRLVASMDLVAIVAPMVIAGLGLLGKKRMGFLLGPVVGVQAFLYLLVLALNTGLQSLRTRTLSTELPMWVSILAAETIAIASLMIKHRRGQGR